jgi:hypothetical protein
MRTAVQTLLAKHFAVYCLTYESEPYYVGCTSNPTRRALEHGVVEDELKVLCIVETQLEGERVEQKLISAFRKRGYQLLNDGHARGIPDEGVIAFQAKMPEWVRQPSDVLKKAETKEERRARRQEVRDKIERGSMMSRIGK